MSRATPTFAIALGAGGARGLAHIVLLEALEELGLRPTAIAGASMGAVIGAAFAAGMPAVDMRSHALRVLRNRRTLLKRALDARVGRFADLLRRRLVNPVLIDAEIFLPPFWPAAIPARFEELAIPLAIVVTDFDGRTELVIDSGDLLSAVAASVAVPGLVKPVRREGLRLIDGGTVNPLPYDRLAERADIVIACDVATGPIAPLRSETQAVAVLLGAAQIMQASMIGRMLASRPPDLLVRPAVDRFRILDFVHAARILEAAEACKDTFKRDVEAVFERVIRRDGC